MRTKGPLYEARDPFVVRVPLLPVHSIQDVCALQWESALCWQDEQALSLALKRDWQMMITWLRQVLATDPGGSLIREAIEIGAPALAHALPLLSEDGGPEKRVHRVAASLFRYLLRM